MPRKCFVYIYEDLKKKLNNSYYLYVVYGNSIIKRKSMTQKFQ